MITKKVVAEKIIQYLQNKLSLAYLIAWAENAIMDEDFDEKDSDLLMEILSKIGLADVKLFGLTWEECEQIFEKLGYSAKIEVVAHK